MDYKKVIDAKGKPYYEIYVKDYALITNPLLNKGMGFPYEERFEFDLLGLIPPREATIEEQESRSYEAFQQKGSEIEKYLYLRDLQDSNETLFYRVLSHHVDEMLPIVYTPTVGLGCQRFSHIYRRPRGIFIAYPNRDDIDVILAKSRFNQVEVIVVSDGERILGLGDQGAGGIGIPIGKLALYSACAGIHPASTLPVLLDTGTNNVDLINDPLYIGWRHERIRDKDYYDFIKKFVTAVKKRFNHVLLQWEDFAQQNAYPILEEYREQLCTFNDDIQGTAAIAVGTLLAAVQVSGVPLKEQRIVIVGAGSAGCGIANLMMEALVDAGLSKKEAQARFYLIDRYGLLTEATPDLLPFQKPFVQSLAAVSQWKLEKNNQISLKDTIKNLHPTVLVGVSGQPGIFTQDIVKEMAQHVEHPIIFPLSNPTHRSEAIPSDILAWTNNKAIIGTGSPFGEVTREGIPFRVDQVNNCYIFPGLGLGLIAVQATKVSDRMFMEAAKALASISPAKNNAKENLLPPLTKIRDVSFQVALAVAKEAINSGLAHNQTNNLEKLIHEKMWEPNYVPYKRAKKL